LVLPSSEAKRGNPLPERFVPFLYALTIYQRILSEFMADISHQPDWHPELRRMPSGIPGLDHLAGGGLPHARATLLCGTSGSGKTVFATQFLAAGIQQYEEGGVFVAFEETPKDIRENMAGFGWDIPRWEKAGKWRFVDAGLRPEEEEALIGDNFNLEALRARIRHAVEMSGAKRVALDSLSAIFTRFDNAGKVRREIFLITSLLKELGVTSVFTTELLASVDATRFEVEEYVADAVILLRHVLQETKRRRTIEVLKLRGGNHRSGQHAMSITPRGINAISVGSIRLVQPSTTNRIASGSAELDGMCGGGFFRDSVTIVSGATGTGKTLTAMQFIQSGAAEGDRCLFLGFEESRSQLVRNASSWGIDLEAIEKQGLLRIDCEFPEARTLEEHLAGIQLVMDEFQPGRVVVDSVTAMERVARDSDYQEFVLSLTSLIKQRQIAGLYTSTTNHLSNITTVTEKNISTLTDAIILLRYVEMQGRIARAITVLKMRGSFHEKTVRAFEISEEGLVIGEPLSHWSGMLGEKPNKEP